MKKILLSFSLLVMLSVSAYAVLGTKTVGEVNESCAPGVCHTHSDGVYWCH